MFQEKLHESNMQGFLYRDPKTCFSVLQAVSYDSRVRDITLEGRLRKRSWQKAILDHSLERLCYVEKAWRQGTRAWGMQLKERPVFRSGVAGRLYWTMDWGPEHRFDPQLQSIVGQK